jgi:hypothetical protein
VSTSVVLRVRRCAGIGLCAWVAMHVCSAEVDWRVVERASISWLPNARSYEVLVEQSVPASSDQDPVNRVRIRVPGHPDFAVIDDRGPGPFVVVREAMPLSLVRKLSFRTTSDSTHLFLTAATSGGKEPPVLLIFGWAYASDPRYLIVIGLDSQGRPVLRYREEFDIRNIVDLDRDGRAEIVGLRSLSETIGQCGSTTYDPYVVLRVPPDGAAPLVADTELSRAYNLKHYIWAGPDSDHDIEVNRCVPGKLRIVRRGGKSGVVSPEAPRHHR